MIRRSLAAAAVLMVVILAASCANDEANPHGSGTNPTASTITAAVSGNTATITWTQCPDDDFSSYILSRSKSSGIAAGSSSADVVTVITDQGTLTYSDGGLDWNTPYYYALQTVDSSMLTSWSNEATITTPDSSGSGGGDALSCYQIQGQADESPYDGQDVAVTGIVTVGGDEYYAGSGNAQYAVIEDVAGGEWGGLLLYGYDGVLNGLERGDSVVVSGNVSEYDMDGVWVSPVTEVVVESVDFDEAGHTIPAPVELSTGDMSQEKWEGVLAALSDVTVTNEDMGHGDWLVDDGSGDAMVDDMGIHGYTVSLGDDFSEIIGVVLFSFDDYKLEPRNLDDITE